MKKLICTIFVVLSIYSSVYAAEYYSSIGVSKDPNGKWMFCILTATPSLKACKEITKAYSDNYSRLGFIVLVAKNVKSTDYLVKNMTYERAFKDIMENKTEKDGNRNPYLSFIDKKGYQTRMDYVGIDQQGCIKELTRLQQGLKKQGINARLIY